MTKYQGFTLMELLIAIAILGVLMGVGVPTYQQHLLKAKFSEVKMAVLPYKMAVEEAVITQNITKMASLTDKKLGLAVLKPSKNSVLKQVAIKNGVITATGTADVDKLTYTLTPIFPEKGKIGLIEWEVGGSCLKANVC